MFYELINIFSVCQCEVIRVRFEYEYAHICPDANAVSVLS